jgi:putative endonuclease
MNQRLVSNLKALKGIAAENVARRYLEDKGLTLVATNFRCKLGEIDLIMNHHTTLVFVEVRYRNNKTYGSGLDSINHKKQKKIVRAAQYYLQQGYGNRLPCCRFDAIDVKGDLSDSPQCEWISNAFYGS